MVTRLQYSAALVRRVTTIERIPEVARLARENLATVGIKNVEVIVGDGTVGSPQNAPYDGIIITAATPSVPRPLIEQLEEGGRLVAPVGGRDIQELVRPQKKRWIYHRGTPRRSQVRSSYRGMRMEWVTGENYRYYAPAL